MVFSRDGKGKRAVSIAAIPYSGSMSFTGANNDKDALREAALIEKEYARRADRKNALAKTLREIANNL